MTSHNGSHTRKGSRPNTPAGDKLVNITNGERVRRLPRSQAAGYVQRGDWVYCPKKYIPGV